MIKRSVFVLVAVFVFLHSCDNYIQDIGRVSDVDSRAEEPDSDNNNSDEVILDSDGESEDSAQDEEVESEVDED
ncbi:hypothetical protein KAH37_03740, partial [bacterium]|nr:hypothetical protein [bacterium]